MHASLYQTYNGYIVEWKYTVSDIRVSSAVFNLGQM